MDRMMSAIAIFRQLTSDTPANPMATLEMMTQTNHPEQLSPLAQRAWKRIESEFPSWTAHLNTRERELEFAVPAPTGSAAGHLVAFSNHDELWIRFSPPNMCYPADDENELTSLIKRLTADEIVFKVVRKDGEWVETTLTVPDGRGETIPGHTVQFISWTGMADANY